VEEGESPFDPGISALRTAAILSGFIERREDVGKKKKDWVREKYVFADENEEPLVKDEKRKKVNENQMIDQIGGQKELTSNGMKKWKWYGKKLRKDATRDARKAAKKEAVEGGDNAPSRCENLTDNASNGQPPGDDITGDID
jgi:hypothetical protein